MTEVLLGTSGWSYDEWVGPFYDSKSQSKLSKYSTIFETVEIDSTFYSYPTEGMIKGIMKSVPQDFTFSAKVPKVITHEKKLAVERDVRRDMERFCNLLRPLLEEGMLGCLLIQLGPSFTYRPATLRRFLESLPGEFRYAVEFRHISWINPYTFDILRDYNVSYTIVDEPLLPPITEVTADIAYIRWHGHGSNPWFDYHYSKEELEPWVERIRSVSSKARKILGYFNNHYKGYAVHNCLQMMEMLGISNEVRRKALRKAELHILGKGIEGFGAGKEG